MTRGPVAVVGVRLVGELAVIQGNRLRSAQDLGSRKARTLLARLAVEHRCRITVDQIVETLWGDMPPRRAAANVATLVSRLRSALGSDAIMGGRTGYWLGRSVNVDLYEAARLASVAESRLAGGQPSSALATAEFAEQLLAAGTVLPDQPDAEWAEPARAMHVTLLRRARHAIGRAALAVGRPWVARTAAEAAIAADPIDEAACRALMRANYAAGEPARALTVYGQLRADLAAELGVDPAPSTQQLHVAILQNR
jgi:DNA-binding SARP family transcriptional activator